MAREPRKVLGQSTHSLSVPIAAFTMAILLGTYCITSIRAARRDAKQRPMYSSHQHQHQHTKPSASESSADSTTTEKSWIIQQMEKKKEEEKAREEAYRRLRGEGK